MVKVIKMPKCFPMIYPSKIDGNSHASIVGKLLKIKCHEDSFSHVQKATITSGI